MFQARPSAEASTILSLGSASEPKSVKLELGSATEEREEVVKISLKHSPSEVDSKAAAQKAIEKSKPAPEKAEESQPAEGKDKIKK